MTRIITSSIIHLVIKLLNFAVLTDIRRHFALLSTCRTLNLHNVNSIILNFVKLEPFSVLQYFF